MSDEPPGKDRPSDQPEDVAPAADPASEGVERARLFASAYADVTKKLHKLSDEITSEMERLGLRKPPES